MFLQSLRPIALPLILVALIAPSASANWLAEWFMPAGHEELPTPQPELLMPADSPVPMPEPLPMDGPLPTEGAVSLEKPMPADGPMPTLVPPHQSHRWTDEEWPAEGEVVVPDSVGSGLPSDVATDSSVWSNVWEEGQTDEGVVVFDPPAPLDAPEFLDSGSPHACDERPTIRYWNHPLIGLATAAGDAGAKQWAVLELAGECCPLQVPVCIPACCVGAPECDTQHGLLGRTTHSYEWPCGYRVKIVQWGQGDVIVHTYNPPDSLSLCASFSSGRELIEL